ncbi:MAG TPA: hypothetical protein VKD67_04860 [Acidimicrobiales bacterium]|nr:hypothetical protein [Acidimicrobiales bacterium]
MHEIVLGFVLSAVVLLVVVAAFAPLAFSWPRHVRWVVAAQSVGRVDPMSCWSSFDLRHVELTAVVAGQGRTQLHVLEAGHPASHTVVLERDTPPPPDLATMLQEWAALRTPMLLYIDPAGRATLAGPVAAVSGLTCRRVDARRPNVPS